jgi:hypothetical protein
MVALVPAIGGEGRIFGGSPQDPIDNVLVVAAPAGPDRAQEAVFSMLRELSFPLVREVMEEAGRQSGNPSEVESLAATAAVRSGALVLEMTSPEAVEDYQIFFLSQIRGSFPGGEGTDTAFAQDFRLDTEFEAALRDKIRATITNGGEG